MVFSEYNVEGYLESLHTELVSRVVREMRFGEGPS